MNMYDDAEGSFLVTSQKTCLGGYNLSRAGGCPQRAVESSPGCGVGEWPRVTTVPTPPYTVVINSPRTIRYKFLQKNTIYSMRVYLNIFRIQGVQDKIVLLMLRRACQATSDSRPTNSSRTFGYNILQNKNFRVDSRRRQKFRDYRESSAFLLVSSDIQP